MKLADAMALVRRRLRLRAAAKVAGSCIVAGACVAIVAAVVVRYWPIWPETVARAWLALLPVLACVVGFVVGYAARRPRPLDAAVALDQGLGLKERAATVLLAAEAAEESALPIVRAQAERCVERTSAADIARRFTLPARRSLLLWLAGAAAAVLLAPLLPGPGAANASPVANRDRERERETQRVREAARKLETQAAELENAALQRKLEEARKLSRRAQVEAKDLATRPPTQKEALVRLSKLEDDVKKGASALLDVDPSVAFGDDSDELLDKLSELARELDLLDPESLSADLDELRKLTREEKDQAAAEGRAPEFDLARVQDLMDRIRPLEQQLERMKEMLERSGEQEYQALSQELLEQLERLRERLDQLGKNCGACQGAGRPMTKEEMEQLEEMLRQLGSMSDEEFARLLEMLREAESMQAMQRMLAQARSSMCGGGMSSGQGMGEQELSAMLGRLQRAQRAGSNGGSGGQLGPNEGQGTGGQAQRGEDQGNELAPERVRGQLDPSGDLGRRIPFKGIPSPKEATQAFDATLQQAVADAEESLGKDLVPVEAQPFVRRYFDALKRSE